MYDLIIIGAGPAGISAALYAARQKLNFLVLTEDIGGLANFVPSLKTYLGIHYISGYDLVSKFKEHLKDFKVPLKTGTDVKEIRKLKKGFLIKTNKGEYESKAVIISSGRRFKKLEIKGEKEFEGKGLSFCAACEGPMFRDKTVAIIGGGRSGLFSCLFMLSLAKKIYLVEKEDRIKESGGLREVTRIIKSNPKVEIVTGAYPKEIIGNRFVNSIKIVENNRDKILKVDGVFVEIGYEPNTNFLKNLVKLNDRKEIIIDKTNMSSMKGIFAAGDVTDIPEKQVIVSVGEGAKAVLSAILFLEGA